MLKLIQPLGDHREVKSWSPGSPVEEVLAVHVAILLSKYLPRGSMGWG